MQAGRVASNLATLCAIISIPGGSQQNVNQAGELVKKAIAEDKKSDIDGRSNILSQSNHDINTETRLSLFNFGRNCAEKKLFLGAEARRKAWASFNDAIAGYKNGVKESSSSTTDEELDAALNPKGRKCMVDQFGAEPSSEAISSP